MSNRKRIVLAGGSGFLGQALAGHLGKSGHEIVILTRTPRPRTDDAREVGWDGSAQGPWQEDLEGALAVINLTGKSVNCRYTAANRKEILESRVNSTRCLGEAIGSCRIPPPVWLNASTATVYRHTFDAAWDERGETEASGEAKDGFSVEVAWAWERALAEAATPQTRKVALRTSMVLGLSRNSVFPVLRRLTRLGLGGKLDSGRQFVSWIHELDYCRAIDWLLAHEELSGPINVTAPNPVTNAEMMRIMRGICGVPIGLPASGWMLEVGAFLMRTETELVLKSRRVVPGRLLRSGFEFRFAEIRQAFEDLNSNGGVSLGRGRY
jgi:uncharacterized protein (TIGR01777 family)